ncbi:MAG: TspO/MBR family protein [Pseudomonadota bacterium]
MMDLIILLGLGLAVMGAASTGAVYKPGAWYEGLAKPGWTPPNWLFPVAWMVLYVLMILAAWRVASGLAAGAYGASSGAAMAGMAFWTAQITLNGIWSPLFFGIRRPDGAMVAILPLWASVILTAVFFGQVDLTAALLFVPYIVWTSYAGALNWKILQMNSDEKWGFPESA